MKGVTALAYDFTGGCGMTGRTGSATDNVFPFSFANSLCSPLIERCIALIAGFGGGVAVASLLTAPTSIGYAARGSNYLSDSHFILSS